MPSLKIKTDDKQKEITKADIQYVCIVLIYYVLGARPLGFRR